MAKAFHLAQSIALVSLALAFSTAFAKADPTPYFGRWTVIDDKPVFTPRGKLYKTIDVARCGADFCGVSVDDDNKCGTTLFRFLTIHANNDQLTGHGLWGSDKKKLIIVYAGREDKVPHLMLGLGADDMDLTGREGSMPTYQANYKSLGPATCTAE